MSNTEFNIKQGSPTKKFNKSHPVAGCAGHALGCGCSFVACWVAAWVLSAFLAPLFGQTSGGNTIIGMLLAALTCGGSLVVGAVLSFLVGRVFPILKNKAG